MARGFLSGAVLGLTVSVVAAVGLSLLTGGPVMQDAPPEATALDVPAGTEFRQSRDDRATSLPASEPVSAPVEVSKVRAPAPDTLAHLEDADTVPPQPPATGAVQEAPSAPAAESLPSASTDIPLLSDSPVQPGTIAVAPQPPTEEPAPLVSTEPAEPTPPATEATQTAQQTEPASEPPLDSAAQAMSGKSADTDSVGKAQPEPVTEPEPETEIAAPVPEVQSVAPAELAAPDIPDSDSVAMAGSGAADTPKPSDMAGQAVSRAEPGSAPDVATAPAVPTRPAQAETDPKTETAAPAPAAVAQADSGETATVVSRTTEQPAKPESAARQTGPVVTGAATDAQAETAPEPSSETAIRVGKPASGFKNLGTGVQTGRLPSVGSGEEQGGRLPLLGASREAQAAAADDGASSAPDTSALPPVKRFAADFQGVDGKPKMAIVLIDQGPGPVGIEALSSFPYPLSFAIDTSREDAAERMAIFRTAGFEVLAMVALPQGASPTDVEVAMPVLMGKVPEAVGVMEAPGDGIQFDRKVSDQVAQILAASGHGLLLYPKGLNTAQKLAAKNGVPSSVIFRDIDGQDQRAGAIRRFLSYGALNAGNEGGVVLVGRLQPDTVTALLLWGLEDRAGQVALAPVSQLLDAR
ncbi:divergent polysaccharide deacetylase family protein [Marimonas arenosa]|uniref:Divergent polysaccharide deacetylase family protein n=1 Tax=Marimonas arenosa TaxID=1795305 RepID=A0AAE3WB42_9RHOB|nr:divergent polysaccharide deacetylase family protein [Marimonas arenosa]MDQ2088547.1 divergent polysaccharide deacetylase family protein [Marimonas arenosa]